ncbi:MAG TPA: hypothetical protein VKB50_06300 [Vicinamibacterales bacterium]|nr:hypothetical protein [Vicinamibacterales bacterium]
MKTSLTVLVLLLVIAPSVRAQGAYVSAFLTGDVVRLDNVEGTGRGESRNGEAIGFALRLGTELSPKWGVELEFARPAEIETVDSPGIVPLPAGPPVVVSPGGGGITIPDSSVLPIFSYGLRTRQRNTTLSPALWVRQELSTRVSLVYAAGAAFRRQTSELTIEVQPTPILGAPIVFPPTVTKTTVYDVGAFAGIESRIGLTQNVQLVPGIRLLGISNGWLLRPSVGMGWRF